MRNGSWLGVALVIAGAGCGGTSPPGDAGSDTSTAADSGPSACGAGRVSASGYLATLDEARRVGFADGFQACVVGTSDCVTTEPLGAYTLCVPASADGLLSFSRAGSPRWMRPFRSTTLPVNTQTVAMPTQAATDQMLGPIGGVGATTGYAIVFVQGAVTVGDLEGVPGFEVSSTTSGAIVHYVAADGLHLDDTATMTTASGLALIAVPGASADETAPTRVDVRVALAAGQPAPTSCRADPTLTWLDGTQTATTYQAHSAVVGGRFTYAVFVHCPTG